MQSTWITPTITWATARLVNLLAFANYFPCRFWRTSVSSALQNCVETEIIDFSSCPQKRSHLQPHEASSCWVEKRLWPKLWFSRMHGKLNSMIMPCTRWKEVWDPPHLLIPDDEAVAVLLYKLLKVYITETLYMHDHCIWLICGLEANPPSNGQNFQILPISKTPNERCKLFLDIADLNHVRKKKEMFRFLVLANKKQVSFFLTPIIYLKHRCVRDVPLRASVVRA